MSSESVEVEEEEIEESNSGKRGLQLIEFRVRESPEDAVYTAIIQGWGHAHTLQHLFGAALTTSRFSFLTAVSNVRRPKDLGAGELWAHGYPTNSKKVSTSLFPYRQFKDMMDMCSGVYIHRVPFEDVLYASRRLDPSENAESLLKRSVFHPVQKLREVKCGLFVFSGIHQAAVEPLPKKGAPDKSKESDKVQKSESQESSKEESTKKDPEEKTSPNNDKSTVERTFFSIIINGHSFAEARNSIRQRLIERGQGRTPLWRGDPKDIRTFYWTLSGSTGAELCEIIEKEGILMANGINTDRNPDDPDDPLFEVQTYESFEDALVFSKFERAHHCAVMGLDFRARLSKPNSY